MTTPPDKLCTRPHGLPCLAHKRVMLGDLAPCDNCAPHRDRVRQLILSSPAKQPQLQHA